MTSTAGAVAQHLFERGAIVLGGLLIAGALIAGVARRSFVSLAAFFVVAGFALGAGGLHVLRFPPRSGFVQGLASVALIVILFRDGLEVEAEMLRSAWHLPLRKLVLAMPITAAIIACATRLLTGLGWTESFLVGALLAPTDPVLSASVVTNPRVPRIVRHSLNLESGLNDGLALPAVLALLAALQPGRSGFDWPSFLIENVGIGVGVGVAFGFATARLLPRQLSLGGDLGQGQKALCGLGVAFAAYGSATLLPNGNGLIAVFVAAITLGIRREDVRVAFEVWMEQLVEIVKLGIFVVFGSLLTLPGIFADGIAAVGVVAIALLVARPAAILIALAGTRADLATRAFMGWFGPKGVATMSFSLIVLTGGIASGARIFHLAALAVFTSVIAHGLTDHAGAEWIAARSQAGSVGEPDAEIRTADG